MLFVVQDREKDTFALDDFPKICRFCLRSDYLMTDMFHPTIATQSLTDDSLQNKIKRAFQLEVAENDGLPPNICFRCINRIEIYTEYRDKCIENDKILRSVTSYKDILKHIKVEDDSEAIEISDEPEDVELQENYEHEIRQMNYMKAIQGISEFHPDENSQLLVVDPTKDYCSTDESDESVHSIEEPQPLISQTNSQQHSEIFRNVFSCKYCDRAFTNNEDCELHENNDHDQLLPYKCNYCDFLNDNRNTVILHIKDFHGVEKPFICVICGKGFNRRSDLKKHTIVHTGVRPFTCPVCNKNFSRNTNLTKHLRIHTGHKPHVCPNCPRSFITKSDLFRHFNIHLDDKSFKCSHCDSKFSRKDKMQAHERKFHAPRIDLVPPNSLIDSKHETAIGINNVPLSATNMMTGAHSEEPDAINMVISLDPFNDMEHHHPHNNEEENHNNGFSVPDHIQNLDLLFPGHVTGDLQAAYQSTKKEQQSVENALFSCDLCPNKYATKTSLRNHRNIHLGLRNHICHVCQKGFLRKRELDRHSVTHTGIKPFACSVCPKRFGRKDKLMRHMKIHCDDKNKIFNCNECPATFNRRDGLNEHLQFHFKVQQDQLLLDMKEEDEKMLQ